MGAGDNIVTYKPKPPFEKPLKDPVPEPQTALETAPEPVAVTYTAPAYTAPVVGVTGCGSDPNMAYIYQRESGCRTDAVGPNGPCGLGQALPCSKMGCSLSDWACQNNFFTAYALSVYGSTYNAMLFWQSHSWW